MISVRRVFSRVILRLLPISRFCRINAFFFRFQGYNIHTSARIYSTAQIIGDIEVSIGRNTFIGHESLIMGGESKIIIGDDCDISSRVSIISGTHKIDMVEKRSAGAGTGFDIFIEDGVWIGFGAIVGPGVKIGRKSIIGAGSVVVNDIPSYCIAVGNPCKPIKKWNSEKLVFEIIK